jgi:integrase
MKTHNPDNERIKRRYFNFLTHAHGFSEASIDAVAKAVHRFENYTQFRSFRDFHIEQAKAFKANLAEQVNRRTKDRLSKATLHSTLNALKRLFTWLAGQPGFKSRIAYEDGQYFNLSAKEARVAKARRDDRVPTLDQIRHVIETMPFATEIDRRNRALMAFIILTGARDRAVASIKLRHVDVEQGLVDQDARQVATKFSKSFPTWFFPVGDDLVQIVADWVAYLRKEKLWGLDDPVFPMTKVELGPNRQFGVVGLERKHWTNATPIRKIFKIAFENAGLAYFNPHSFRKTLVQLGERLCRTPEQFKAWSQNLGHEKVLTTFSSYGIVGRDRQREILSELSQPTDTNPELEKLTKEFLSRAMKTQAGLLVKLDV